MDARSKIEIELSLAVGTGATLHVGSDSYPYYISEVLPNGVYGLYSPTARFDDKHPWEGGTQVVDQFDSNRKSEFYLKIRYGKWWKVDQDGKPISRYSSKYHTIRFKGAYSYRDPSF